MSNELDDFDHYYSRPVKIGDLKLIYSQVCEQYGQIHFFRNSTEGKQVFKYTKSADNQLQRIQCNCCTLDFGRMWSTPVKDVADWKLQPLSEVVDDVTKNFISLDLQFSSYCAEQNVMAIYAYDWTGDKILKRMTFDPLTGKFTRRRCRPSCCGLKTHSHHEFYDFGTRHVRFARDHRERFGNALTCLSIDWHDKKNGVMSVFATVDGFIGRFLYDAELDCFEFAEDLNVRVMPKKLHPAIERKKPEMIFDNQIDVKYAQDCPALGNKIYFGFIHGEVRKFVYNPVYMQFDLIECPDCTYCPDRSNARDGRNSVIVIDSSTAEEKAVIIYRNTKGKLEMKIYCGQVYRKLTPAPVRNLTHLSMEELKEKHKKEREISFALGLMLHDKEGNIYHGLSETMIVDLHGRITACNRIDMRIVEKTGILMDSDLLPQKIGFCHDLDTPVFSAINSQDPSEDPRSYVYNTVENEVRQIYCCQVHPEGQKVEHGSVAVYGDISLVVDEKGHLVKYRYNEKLEVLEPKPVVRTFGWEKSPKNFPKKDEEETAFDFEDLAVLMDDVSEGSSDESWCMEDGEDEN